MEKELPVRKKIRLQGYDYSTPGYYFVTVCVEDGHEMLGRITVGATVPGRPCMELSEVGGCVDSAIKYYITNNVINIDKYVIMPNHIHLIIIIQSELGIQSESGDRGRSPLQYKVRSLKSYITKQIGYSMWQKSFYDEIIRNEEAYQNIWRYIDNNPAKWAEDDYYVKGIKIT